MHVGLVVLVKRMSVLINFLLQNTKLVSVLGKNLPKFCWSCMTGLTQVANSDDMRLEIQIGAKKCDRLNMLMVFQLATAIESHDGFYPCEKYRFR